MQKGTDYECSTPFGIRGICTHDRLESLDLERDVLNAFRHQRYLHICSAAKHKAIASGAQRLSASEVFARSKQSQLSNQYICAQRLSASEVFARLYLPAQKQPAKVLNAFRHQRYLHIVNLGQYLGFLSSAQRLSASEVFALVLQ